MSRSLSSAMLAAIAQGTIYPILFGFLDFADGAVYACTHNRTVAWNGHNWSGLGEFVQASTIQETSAIQANSFTLTLNGAPASLMTIILGTRSRGRNCTLWQGFFNSSGTLLADPIVIFSGRMEPPTVNNTGASATVAVMVESRLADLQRAREIRYTDAQQKSMFPTDTGLAFVAALQNKDIIWGATATPLSSLAGTVLPVIPDPTGVYTGN